jgi:PAS domain S-box-containing protein
MRDAVVVVDGTGRVADLNAAAEELLQAPLETAVGRPVEDVFPAWSRLAATFPEGDVLRTELELQVQGARRSFDAALTPLGGPHGRAEGLVAVLHDLSERKRAEEQVRLQGVALESAANGMLITDAAGKVLWVNAAFTRMSGYAAADIVGGTPRLLRSGVHDAAFYRNLWQTIGSGRVWRGEIVNRRRDGSLYVEDQTITPVRDGEGRVTHHIAIKQDVTERRELEKLRESLTRTMVHAT